jgi:3-deoxy-D-manno-octulosonic-acid transferase
LVNGKEHPKRAPEKLGFYNLKRPEGNIIWFHAASVGELNSITEIVKILSQDNNILITTGTLNSYKVFDKIGFNKNVIHQFAPLDSPEIVKRFLQYWQPSKGIFTDSELWPNLICHASKQMPLYNVNARLSDKSFQTWQYFGSLARYLYSQFTYVIACSEYDLKKISHFVDSTKLHCFGNLKCSTPPLSDNVAISDTLKDQCADRLVIVAASTHDGEEEIILDSLLDNFKSDPRILLILVPRDVSRGLDILKLCISKKLDASVRTDTDQISNTAQVYIANTLGELGIWYRLSKIAFVGGSLVDVGGHNIIEPAQLGNAIISGNHYSNFKDIFDLFIKKDAIQIASNTSELKNTFSNLISNKNAIENYAKNAKSAATCDNIIDNVLSIITKTS